MKKIQVLLRQKQNWYCVGKLLFPRLSTYELDLLWSNPFVLFCSFILTPVSTYSHLCSAGPCTVEQIASVLINCCNSQRASLSISGTYQKRRFSQRFILPFYVPRGNESAKYNTMCPDFVSEITSLPVTLVISEGFNCWLLVAILLNMAKHETQSI